MTVIEGRCAGGPGEGARRGGANLKAVWIQGPQELKGSWSPGSCHLFSHIPCRRAFQSRVEKLKQDRVFPGEMPGAPPLAPLSPHTLDVLIALLLARRWHPANGSLLGACWVHWWDTGEGQGRREPCCLRVRPATTRVT